jgi:hypothetical protein
LKFDFPQHDAALSKKMEARGVVIHGSHRNRIVKVSHMWFLHDCLIKGLGSLPKF